MPIKLDDLQAASANTKVFNPKFFDKKLTGRGGNTPGFLADRNNPLNISEDISTLAIDCSTSHSTAKSNDVTYTFIPVNPLCKNALSTIFTTQRPDINQMACIAEKNGRQLYFSMKPHTLSIAESSSYDSYTGQQDKKEFRACYEISLFNTKNAANSLYNHDMSNYSKACKPAVPQSHSIYENIVTFSYSTNPKKEVLYDYMTSLAADGWKVNTYNLQTYLENYDLYTEICRRSEEWQDKIDIIVENFLRDSADPITKQPNVQAAIEEMVHLMMYNIPLPMYKKIYDIILRTFTPDEARKICKQNLNLLLSDTLNSLSNTKAQIPNFTPNPNAPVPCSIQKLSPEQIRAVTSTEPLILVQAGAGTGKSTLILGRIDYLISQGVNPNDITVLSFTNAAADHIKEKNPRIHSMTIARMIHEIYTANFKHELSSLDTIQNSIDIYFPPTLSNSSSITDRFKRHIRNIIKNEPNCLIAMNTFIEENYDEVMKILDAINQTSLELEIIICYQQIANLVEPPTVMSKYLIIDEVQDNSIFEFIYTLCYIEKKKQSLFIVGDCSQTLYEFRASNPRALNILESSKTFTAYQLTTNYRSRQEILDFANVALTNIEANQYAQIQLHANDLTAVTEASFLEKVHFYYMRLAQIRKWHEMLPSVFAKEMHQYIQERLDKKEQIAIIAHTRNDVAVVQQILQKQYPQAKIANLVPERTRNLTIFSTFIKQYWDTIKFVPYTNIGSIIYQECMGKISYIIPYANSQAYAQAFVANWEKDTRPTINAWIQLVTVGAMSEQELIENVKRSMLQYEIQKNAIRQSLSAEQNRKAKENNSAAKADFIISTIHSAKGLEFPHVIVLYKSESGMTEDKKRMYYVAFTRAMQSEYVLAYGTPANSQIQADYETVLRRLHAAAPAPNSPLAKSKKKS